MYLNALSWNGLDTDAPSIITQEKTDAEVLFFIFLFIYFTALKGLIFYKVFNNQQEKSRLFAFSHFLPLLLFASGPMR